MATYQQILTSLEGMSASGSGTAIFYSGQQTNNGVITSNQKLADDCQETNPNTTYTIFNTQAGQYLSSAAVIDSDITDAEYQNLWNVASQMFAQQASGPVIAFVDGDLPLNGVFQNYELPTLLGNSDITSINGISVNALDSAANGNPIENFSNVLSFLGPTSGCFDGTPPSASAPVTGIPAIQDDVTSSNGPNTITPGDSAATDAFLGTVAAIGLTALGAAAYFSGVGEVATAVAAGIVLLSNGAANAQEPTSLEQQSELINQGQLESYDALELAPAYAEMRENVLLSDGVLTQLTSLSDFQTSLLDLDATLQSNGDLLSGAVDLPSGQQLNVGLSLAANGDMTYTEAGTGTQSDGDDLLSSNDNSAILSQSDVFTNSGADVSNVIEFMSGGSQLQTLSYSSGTTTEQDWGYSGSDQTGTQLYQQTTVVTSSGQENIDISGQEDATDQDDANITIANSSSVVIDGDNDAITAGDNVSATVDGTNSIYYVGQDDLSFSTNTLESFVTNSSDTASFDVESAASNYSEGITWSPTTGETFLTLTPTDGAPITTALGQINPGDVFEASSSLVTLSNSSDQEMESTQVESNGSQIDTTYDTTGGTWSNEAYYYNDAGDETEVQYNNTDNDDVYDFYNPSADEALAAQQLVDANGSGEITANNFVLDYADGDDPSVSVGANGGVTATVTADDVTNTIELSSTGITTDVGGHTLSDTISDASASVNSADEVTLTMGGSTLTEAANGSTDTFAIGQDDIDLTAASVTSISLDSGVDDFSVDSVAEGYSESVDWNPTTGKAVLDITDNATDTTFASSLGYINPGDVLDVNGSTDALYNSSGEELNATDINSNGSQDDISYDTAGGTWASESYDYNSAGEQTEIATTNTNGSNTYDYYNPTNGDLSAELATNSNGSGSITLGDGDSASFTPASGETMQVTWDQATNSLIVSGDGTLTGASGSMGTIDIDNDSDVDLTTSDSNVVLEGTGTVSLDGNGNTLSAASGVTDDTVSADGNTNTISVNASSTVSDIGTGDVVDASGDTVNLGSSTSVTVDGGSDHIDAETGATGDTVSADGNTNTISVNASSTVSDIGTGDVIDASGDTVNLGSSTSVTVDGASDHVDAETGATTDTVTIDGNTNTVSLNGSSTVGLTGTSETVDASSDTVNLGSSTSVTVDGGSDHIDANTGATSDTVSADGNTNTISVNASSTVSDTGTGDVVDASSDTLNLGSSTSVTVDGASDHIDAETGATSDTVNVDGNTNTVSLNGSSTVGLTGTSETVDASSDTVDLGNSATVTVDGSSNQIDADTGADGNQVTVDGNTNTMNLNTGSTTLLTGSDEAVNESGGTVLATSDTIANIDGSNDYIESYGAATDDTASVDGSGDTVQLGADSGVQFTGTDDEVVASSDVVYATSNSDVTIEGEHDDISAVSGATDDTFGLNGDDDQLSANSDSTVDVTGIGDAIDASGDDIDVSSSTETSLDGSHDTVNGGSSDTIYVNGENDSVSDTDSYTDFSGDTSGDTVSGSDDTDIGGSGDGGGPDAGDGDGGDGDGGDGDAGGGDGGYDFVKTKNANLPALLQYNQAVAATNGNSSISVDEGASWGQATAGEPKIITWSFADSNTGTSSSDQFSNYITNAQEQAIVEEAVEEWGQASGIVFEEVSDSQSADIRIGFGDFNTTSTGVIGYTDYTSSDGIMNPGTVIRVEDPFQLSLETNSEGQLVYSGTGATFEQVVLHELGHALGLADNIDPNSVMYYESTSANQTLDSTDVAGIQALYSGSGGSSTKATTSAPASSEAIQLNSQWQKFVQAGADFNADHSWSADTDGTGNFIPPYHHTSALAAAHT